MVFIRAKKIGNKTHYYAIRTKFNKEKKWSEQKVFLIGDKEALKKFYDSIRKKIE